MATSTIKAPITDYVVVAESGTTSATIASKLATLRTALESLTISERHKTFLMIGNGIYNVQNVASSKFANLSGNSDGFVLGEISLGSTQQTFREYVLKTSGLTINDLTNITSTSNYQLCYWI